MVTSSYYQTNQIVKRLFEKEKPLKIPTAEELILASQEAFAVERTEELADVLRLLGDPNRLRIALLCLGKPLAVSKIAESLDLSVSLASHHLRLLRAARLLQGRRKGRQVFYSTSDDRVRCVLVDMVMHISKPPADKDKD